MPGCPQSPARGVSFFASLLRFWCVHLCLIASANSLLRSVHEGSGYLFHGNELRLYYRGNHKYLPGRQKVSK